MNNPGHVDRGCGWFVSLNAISYDFTAACSVM